MLPLVFLPDTPVLLAGRGPAFAKRRALLEAAGLARLALHEGLPPAGALDGPRLIFGAGLSDAESEWLATAARVRGIPVNIEDVPHLCDMHVPALVRRGDLLLTVSTGGSAPALSAALRAWLEGAFGEEWAGRLEEVAALRAQLRAEGSTPAEVIRGVRAHLDATGWLAPAGAAPAR
ncbi:precorrin-2 dehydrogenase/sirohydrochlorin ferrochelatase family protein [Falsiroseomonas oryzae]|uniref:precorrin-2 dehydrogenase/sirohydrochlorin ferrochelatase family protein n=1 Tax=Falsiroseomonas oryzae TaxID=2766473 RepID=UPI0022EB7EC1|nr:NAD(P)-dependent oxidoreductase [Roseomonas sp. MO-31]